MNDKQKRTLALLNITRVPDLDLIVPRGQLPEKLQAEITPSETAKLLVAGQRGMGKTTELRRLVDLLRADNECIPIFLQFGSQEEITEAALIVAMAETLVREPDLALPASSLHAITKWQEDEIISETLEEGSEGGAGLGGKYILLSAHAGISRKHGRKTQRQRAVTKNKRELLQEFNGLIARARKKSKKRIVFVVDDIDKVQNATSIESTFIHSAQLIGDIETPCVFTVPITYATSTYLRIATLPYTGLYRVPAVPLIDAYGARNAESYQFMRDVFARRMPFNPLTGAQLDRVLEYSGGVLVDAMRILRGVCKDAILKGLAIVPDSVVEEHFQNLVDDYKYLFDSPELWKKLATFCKAKDKSVFVTDDAIPDLLYKMIVIEYRESSMWFDLHPAARRLYDQNQHAVDKRVHDHEKSES
jgi:KAP-like P-loop domain-containing protein